MRGYYVIMGDKECAKPIIAMIQRLNKNNIKFIIDRYLAETNGRRFKQSFDIYNCLNKVCRRCACKMYPINKLDSDTKRIDDDIGTRYKIDLYTEDLTGWYDFNCVIRISKDKDGLYKSEAIYLYIPSEHVSFMNTFTIDTEVERKDK